MNSNEIEQLVQKSIRKEIELERKANRTEKRLKEEENADIEERNKNRALYTIIPYFCTAIAAIGLSRAGIVDPNYVGAISIGVSATVGTIIESKKVRKIVSSRTLDSSSKRILRDRVYDAIELEKLKQKIVLEETKREELEKLSSGDVLVESDLFDDKEKLEDKLNDIAFKIGLKKEIPFHEDTHISRTIGLRDAGLYGLGFFAGYSIPMSIAGADSNSALFIPPIIYGIATLNYHLFKSSEKRRIDNKYRRYTELGFSDDDIKALEELSTIYAKELGIIEAHLDAYKLDNPEEEIVDEEPSLFMEVWEEASKEKDVKTLSKERDSY